MRYSKTCKHFSNIMDAYSINEFNFLILILIPLVEYEDINASLPFIEYCVLVENVSNEKYQLVWETLAVIVT